MTVNIYLARHATPDWSRTDIRYDIPPGPPLTEHGEGEAEKLGAFLRDAGVTKIYASPLERTQRTAALAAAVVGLPVVTEELIAEWRRGETDAEVIGRINGFWERICLESQRNGPVALVTHGGPVKVTLLNLGVPKTAVDEYCRKFDRGNPLPPAGVWLATNRTVDDDGNVDDRAWELTLVFTPSGEMPTVTDETAAATLPQGNNPQTVYV